MEQVNCLNLCEILPYLKKKRQNLEEILKDSEKLAGYETCERLYLGYSFCGKYFLHQSVEDIKNLSCLVRTRGQKITLEVPVFSEGDLESGKKKISQLMDIGGDIIDEVTVNDYGILPLSIHRSSWTLWNAIWTRYMTQVLMALLCLVRNSFRLRRTIG